MRQSGGCLFQWEESMAEKEFDQLTPEEKRQDFRKHSMIITADLLKWIMHCGL